MRAASLKKVLRICTDTKINENRSQTEDISKLVDQEVCFIQWCFLSEYDFLGYANLWYFDSDVQQIRMKIPRYDKNSMRFSNIFCIFFGGGGGQNNEHR